MFCPSPTPTRSARVPAGARRQLWWPRYQHIHQQLFILSYRTHTVGPNLTGGQGNVLNSRAARGHPRPVPLCNLSLLSTLPLHPAVARYNIILCPDSGTCCRQFEIKNKLVGNTRRYRRASMDTPADCSIPFQQVLQPSSPPSFDGGWGEGDNTSLFIENKSALCGPRGCRQLCSLSPGPLSFSAVS